MHGRTAANGATGGLTCRQGRTSNDRCRNMHVVTRSVRQQSMTACVCGPQWLTFSSCQLAKWRRWQGVKLHDRASV